MLLSSVSENLTLHDDGPILISRLRRHVSGNSFRPERSS
jgi:hypothetical protein